VEYDDTGLLSPTTQKDGTKKKRQYTDERQAESGRFLHGKFKSLNMTTKERIISSKEPKL
jgi:hypothetical protein